MPKINAAGLNLIKDYEGLRLHAYTDSVGVWTIGYGHTGDCAAIGMGLVQPGMQITIAQAETLLRADLAKFENGVNELVTRNLTPNQFAALVSFAYNLGLGALGQSTLLRYVNEGNFAGAAAQFSRWTYAGGKQLPGLVSRRAAEARLFLTPEEKTA